MRDLCASFKSTRDAILRSEVPLDPLDRAAGYRHSTRILRLALDPEAGSHPLVVRQTFDDRGA